MTNPPLKADQEMIGLVDKYKSIHYKISELMKTKEELKLSIIELLGNNDLVFDENGEALVSYKKLILENFDTKRFKETNPELYEEFKVLKESDRLNVNLKFNNI